MIFADDTRKQGKLLAVTEADITIEYTEGKNKKRLPNNWLFHSTI